MTQTRDRTQTTGANVQQGGMPAGQAPAQARPMTAAQRATHEALEARENMLDAVEGAKGDIVKFLQAFGIDYDFFLGGLKVFLMRQVQNQPDFFTKVTRESFMEALFRCAKDGLLPDGKEAAIGHFAGVATYMPMRDGFVKVLWRTGMVKDINDNVVTKPEYDRGHFKYREGDEGFVEHYPDMERKDTDATMAAYCVVRLVTGGVLREVVPKADLEKIAKMSKSPARKEWKFQMDRKAAIRRIMGKMPREKAIVQLLAHDDLNYDSKLIGTGGAEPELPNASLFGNKPVVRRKDREPAPPAIEAEPKAESVTEPEPDDPVIDQDPHAEDEDQTAGQAPEDQPFVLRAMITTSNGVREFDNIDFWQSDLIQKMQVLSTDRTKLLAFWRVNLPLVQEAGRNGFGPAAMKVLEKAETLRLPMELDHG